MSQAIIARRYASALYNEAQKLNAISEVDADVAALITSLQDSRELTLFLKSPVINRDKKQNILARLLDGKVSTTVSNFVRLSVQKGRDSMLIDILGAYQTLRDAEMGVVSATVTMAYQPNADEVSMLQSKLEAMTNKKVRISLKEDETLIGGAVVQIGDTLYDGSVRRQLTVLKKRLMFGN